MNVFMFRNTTNENNRTVPVKDLPLARNVEKNDS